MKRMKTIYVSDHFYTGKTLADEMFDRILDDTGIAYKSKAEAINCRIGDSAVRKYLVTVSIERLPAR